MNLDLKKWAPWNWFKKENEELHSGSTVPVQRDSGKNNYHFPAPPLMQIHHQIDRWFDEMMRGMGMSWPSSVSSGFPFEGLMKPALDLHETKDQYKITIEVPGVDKDVSFR